MKRPTAITLWARKRQPEQAAYLAALPHERFTLPELIEQAKAAGAAGFDGNRPAAAQDNLSRLPADPQKWVQRQKCA